MNECEMTPKLHSKRDPKTERTDRMHAGREPCNRCTTCSRPVVTNLSIRVCATVCPVQIAGLKNDGDVPMIILLLLLSVAILAVDLSKAVLITRKVAKLALTLQRIVRIGA